MQADLGRPRRRLGTKSQLPVLIGLNRHDSRLGFAGPCHHGRKDVAPEWRIKVRIKNGLVNSLPRNLGTVWVPRFDENLARNGQVEWVVDMKCLAQKWRRGDEQNEEQSNPRCGGWMPPEFGLGRRG